MTPLQQEPSAHAPWMRTIFGRAFISGSLRGRFQMTKQIRLCLSARWGGIRNATALRISRYDKQGHVVGRLPISEKNHWPFGKSIFYPNGQWWHIPEKSPLASAMCSQVTDTPAAVLLGKMATGHAVKGPGMNVSGISDQRDFEGISALVTGATS